MLILINAFTVNPIMLVVVCVRVKNNEFPVYKKTEKKLSILLVGAQGIQISFL